MSTAGRNDPCPCGSGQKYKKCCGAQATAAPAVPTAEAPATDSALSDSARRSGWLEYPAENYIRFLKSVPSPADHGFWTECARRFGSPVLCLCAGTGREAFRLAEQGFAVTGVDLNESFLEAAAIQRTVALGSGKTLDLSYVQADIVRMELGRRFPLAILPTQSFQLLLTPADQCQFLTTLHRHLTDGGVFAFNFSMVFRPERKLVDGHGKRPGSAQVPFDAETQVLRMGLLRERLSTLEEVQSLLTATGFTLTHVLGATEKIRPEMLDASAPAQIENTENQYTVLARRA